MTVPESSSVVVKHEEQQAIIINVRGFKRAIYALSCEHEVRIKLYYMSLTLLKA